MPGCASSARRKKKMESAANRRLFWTTAGAVVAADLVTKLLAESLLARHLPVQVIGEYVQLRLVYNQCAAFGLCLGAYSHWLYTRRSWTYTTSAQRSGCVSAPTRAGSSSRSRSSRCSCC